MEKNLWIRDGGSCFSVKIFCLTVPKKFVREPFCVSKKMVPKIFMHRRRGHYVFVENFLIQRTEKFCKGSLLFQKFSGVDKSLCVTDGWGGGGVSHFSVEKNRVSKSFMPQNSVGKNLWIRNGGYYSFPSKFFCLSVPKVFVDEPFCAVFQKISGGEKVYG